MRLGFGLMRLPIIDGDSKNIDIDVFKKMVDEFINAGGTYFDTAYPYHQGYSERALKEALVKRYDRNRYTVTDKMPLWSLTDEKQLEEIFNEQLDRTGLEYFDYYWIHALGRGNYPTCEKFHAFDFIKKKKEMGKIKHIGFSFHDSSDYLDKILNEHDEVEFVQLQINYMDWDDENVQARKCYEVAKRHNKKVIVMEPVKGGSLVNIPTEAKNLFINKNPNLSIPSWAIRYCASLDNVMMVLSGMSNLSQMKDNLSYMKDFKPLDSAEKEVVNNAVKLIKESIAIPCTACRYCIDENKCPKNIIIPEIFKLYNSTKNFSLSPWNANKEYNKLVENTGRISECIKCGGCEKRCPQHLEIRKLLDECSKILKDK